MTAPSSSRLAQTPDSMAGVGAENEAAIKVLMTIHRLAQQSTLYADNNEAQVQAIQAAVDAAHTYATVASKDITIYFSERAAYVGRRLIRGNRAIYTAAAHMRALLAKMGVSQISIAHDVRSSALQKLQAAFAQATQGSQVVVPPSDMAGIQLRAGRPPGEIAELEKLAPEERAVKVYSLAIVIVRRFYEQLQEGKWEISSHVRRISEELIELGGSVTPAVLATTAGRPAHDDAERTVSSALLALCMAQQLTGDRRLLRWLATGALLCDVGKPRVAGLDPDGSRRIGLRIPILGEAQYAELPGATAFVTTALGNLTDAGMMRSVVVYEALHIEHADETGPIYDGERGPAMLSRLLACARRYQYMLSRGTAGADVLAELVTKAANKVERWIVQLLMATLNVLPTGTIVELDDGNWARVVSPPVERIDFGRPLVRIIARPGKRVDSRLVDLNQPVNGGAPPQIARIVAAVDEQQELPQDDHEPAPRRPEVLAVAQVPAPTAPDPSPFAVTEPPPEEDKPEPPRLILNLDERDSEPDAAAPSPFSFATLEPQEDRPKPPRPEPRGAVSDAEPGIPAPSSFVAPELHPVEPALPVSDMAPDSSSAQEAAGAMRAPLIARGKAKAHGTIYKTPLVHLLVYASDHKLDGTLLLVVGDEERCAIVFRDGRPWKTQTRKPASVFAHEDLSEDDIIRLAKQDMVDHVGYMMQLPPDTRYSFYADKDMLAIQPDEYAVECDPLPLIMMGVRKYMDYDAFDQVLPRLANTKLKLRKGATPARMGLKPPERVIVKMIRNKRVTLNDMLADGDVDEDTAQRTIYALAITRQLKIGDEKRPPVGS